MADRTGNLIRDLTDQPLQGADSLTALRRFANEYGWRPSDQIDRYPGTEQFCNGHLVIEHGLDLSAVISFLRAETPYVNLSALERRSLLELSYNNLVDWHLLPELSGMRVVYNRTDPPQDQFFPATVSEDVWRADAFDRLTGKRPNPNFKALDDALIDTVSFWKRAIRGDLGERVGLTQISAIINSVIMVRALEDYKNRLRPSETQLLLSLLDGNTNHGPRVRSLIQEAFESLGQSNLPPWLQSILQDLNSFDDWDATSLREFLRDFYKSKFSPYKYNFHLISKHALSRIYEHYVSVLRNNDASDLRLFNELPQELHNRDLGSFYTPQFIARFFARYLREHRTPRAFRSLRTLDPACGSGMFLRTLLEMQCNPTDDGFSVDAADVAFANAHGVDVDPNACQAAKLSLALLYLVLTGKFPESLNISSGEAIAALQSGNRDFDVLITNPPFIKWDGLSDSMRERILDFMQDHGLGKQDLYLAFLKGAMLRTADGGAICFVLPHSFLLSNSAGKVRSDLSESFAIRVLADLSEIPVFDKTGAYVLLLIAERGGDRTQPALYVKCREFVGNALHDALAGRTIDADGYRVFEVSQKTFKRNRWNILRPEEEALRTLIEVHPKLSDLARVRQGLVTGDDDVFVRPSKECPVKELRVWRPLLPDRDIVRFKSPRRHTTSVFMPFAADDDRKLTEDDLRKNFPSTWDYLSTHKQRLARRSSVRKQTVEWWQPERPRTPSKLYVPKLVTPHLVLLPRFGFDLDGRFAVSRSPYVVALSESPDESTLKILGAVMNSAVGHWQMSYSSHKYSRGYSMLEVKTLSEFHVPNPSGLAATLTRRILKLVNTLMHSEDDESALAQLDRAVCEAYGLSPSQMSALGIGG